MRHFGALGEGPFPKLNWVYKMRQGSRILVLLLAAAAASDPDVMSWLPSSPPPAFPFDILFPQNKWKQFIPDAIAYDSEDHVAIVLYVKN